MARRKYSDQDLARMSTAVAKASMDYWRSADDETRAAGAGWYPVAHAEAELLAKAHGLTTVQAAAVIAVLSPLTRWQGNLEDAWAVCAGKPARHALPRNVEKAKAILAGEWIGNHLRGKKVSAFARNIADPLDFKGTVNDSWIADAFGIDRREMFETAGVYEAVTEGMQRTAAILNVRPSTVQATVWLVVSGNKLEAADVDNLPDPF